MEWSIGIGIAAMFLLCPLMMLGMIVGGWILGRNRISGHGGHSMMCMPHGSHRADDSSGATGSDPTTSASSSHS